MTRYLGGRLNIFAYGSGPPPTVNKIHLHRVVAFHTTSSLRKRPSLCDVPLTADEIEQTRALFKRGFQVWEVAMSLGRDKSVVLCAMRENGHLSKLVKNRKQGEWSLLEEDVLRRYLKKKTIPDKAKISKEMGRTKPSISSHILKICNQLDHPRSLTPSEMSCDLSKGEITTLEARLGRILDGLFKADKADSWDQAIQELPREMWIQNILALIPKPVGHILAAPLPPAVADLETLEWKDTTEMGVYGWLLSSKSPNPYWPRHYFYVGSATKHSFGLSGRRSQHEGHNYGRTTRLRDMIRLKQLRREGHFITLLCMKPVADDPTEIVKARFMGTLAEAALTVWLGGLNRQFEGLHFPWQQKDFMYKGLCTHNPLTKGITYPLGYDGQLPETPALADQLL